MKTGKRSYPLDQLSVSEDGVSVSIHTHRSQIVVSVDDGTFEWSSWIPFQEFASILKDYLAKHGEKGVSLTGTGK